MKLHEVPHGINVVLETHSGRVVIGRFDSTNGFAALLHDCDAKDFEPGSGAAEAFIGETAKYGVDVQHRDLQVDAAEVARVRLLSEIPKPD